MSNEDLKQLHQERFARKKNNEENITNIEFHSKKVLIKEGSHVGVGSHVTLGGHCFLNYLQNHINLDYFKGKTILEIGSGTGVLGICIGILGCKEVVLSDKNDRIQTIQDNIKRNEYLIQSPISVVELDWRETQDIQTEKLKNHEPFDIIIGSEVVFHHDLFEQVCKTISNFSSVGTELILSHTTYVNWEKIKKKDSSSIFSNVKSMSDIIINKDSENQTSKIDLSNKVHTFEELETIEKIKPKVESNQEGPSDERQRQKGVSVSEFISNDDNKFFKLLREYFDYPELFHFSSVGHTDNLIVHENTLKAKTLNPLAHSKTPDVNSPINQTKNQTSSFKTLDYVIYKTKRIIPRINWFKSETSLKVN